MYTVHTPNSYIARLEQTAVHKWYNVGTEFENVHAKLIMHCHLTTHSEILISTSEFLCMYVSHRWECKLSQRDVTLYCNVSHVPLLKLHVFT